MPFRGERLIDLYKACLTWFAATALSVCLACGGGDSPVGFEEQPPNDDPPPDVQLVTLTVTVGVDPGDADVAEEVGWGGGTVPRALVTVRRLGSVREDSVRSDATGQAVFEDLLEGNYAISADRFLDDSERARLSSNNSDVSVLGGGLTTQITPPTEGRALSLTAGRRGSILISEYAFNHITPASGSSYSLGGFLELYNNSDTTIYLDGLIVGSGWHRVVNGGQWPCTDFDFFRADPAGVWTALLHQFPGTGRTHPLRPSETAVLATDAINHGDFIERGLDLSGADFEFQGRADVDNPAVPNLVSIGPEVDLALHGLIYRATTGVPFIAKSIDLDSLPRRSIVISRELEYVRIPRSALLDIGQFIRFGGSIPVCDRTVDPSLDGAAAAIPGDEAQSMQRRVLVSSVDGSTILQDTNTSSRDFTGSPMSPGTVRR